MTRRTRVVIGSLTAYAILLAALWMVKRDGDAAVLWFRDRVETLTVADKLKILLVQHWLRACTALASVTLGAGFWISGSRRSAILVAIALFVATCAGVGHWTGSFETSRALSFLAHDFAGSKLPLRVQIADLLVAAWPIWTPLLLVTLLSLADAATSPRKAR